MVWRVCEFPDRHDYDTSSVTDVAFGGSPSADELQRMVHETFPNVAQHEQRLRADRDELGGHGHQRRRRAGQADVGGAADAGGRVRIADASGATAAAGRDRRDPDPGPDRHAGLLGQARGHGRDHPRRVAAHRRHRPPRRRRLPVRHRPGQGHDHPGRRERVLRRDRAAPGRATRRSPTPPSSGCPTPSWARRSRRWCRWRRAASITEDEVRAVGGRDAGQLQGAHLRGAHG